MAIVCIGTKWCPDYSDYSREYICDAAADVSALPPSYPGSSALVASTGDVYVVNASSQWVKFGEGA